VPCSYYCRCSVWPLLKDCMHWLWADSEVLSDGCKKVCWGLAHCGGGVWVWVFQAASSREARLWSFVDQREFELQGCRQLTRQWMGWRFSQLSTGSFFDSWQMGGEMSFEVLVAVNIKTANFWVEISCSLAPVTMCQPSQYHIPEDCILSSFTNPHTNQLRACL